MRTRVYDLLMQGITAISKVTEATTCFCYRVGDGVSYRGKHMTVQQEMYGSFATQQTSRVDCFLVKRCPVRLPSVDPCDELEFYMYTVNLPGISGRLQQMMTLPADVVINEQVRIETRTFFNKPNPVVVYHLDDSSFPCKFRRGFHSVAIKQLIHPYMHLNQANSYSVSLISNLHCQTLLHSSYELYIVHVFLNHRNF